MTILLYILLWFILGASGFVLFSYAWAKLHGSDKVTINFYLFIFMFGGFYTFLFGLGWFVGHYIDTYKDRINIKLNKEIYSIKLKRKK